MIAHVHIHYDRVPQSRHVRIMNEENLWEARKTFSPDVNGLQRKKKVQAFE